MPRFPKKCCIQNCTGDSFQNSLHEFPSKENVRQKWFENILLHSGENIRFTNNPTVCNMHFEESCYRSTASGRRLLKPDAVPTVFMTSQVYIKEEHLSDSDTCNGFIDGFQDDALNSTNEVSRLTSTERLPLCSSFPVHTLAASSSSAIALPASTRASTPDTVTNEDARRGTKRKRRQDPAESCSSGTRIVNREADNVGTFCNYIQAELMKMPELDAEELLEEMLLVLVKKKKEIRGRSQK